ncbi:hypothetical protein SPI_00010 [Niveomyces insectorum RCEF 264]|uniref:Uncharacterized protein n=1 Tax=Niveomyces insectorum RCEF 264 TaxID=1081102 RepID=A0A167ZR36_9HYPO|nr:hypothetical protein SPI_00010 [Niveomyces insectorum RCEF 264]
MDKTVSALQFGVELELFIRSPKKPFASWQSLAEDVSKRLLEVEVSNHISFGKVKSPENYYEWSIVQEVTIPSQPGESSSIHNAYVVIPSQHCSTHVHISTTPYPLTVLFTVSLAEAALYFEHALDALMPLVRRSSATYWCRSNRESYMLNAYADINDLRSCLAIVRYGYEHAAFSVPEAVNLLSADSAYGCAHGGKNSFVHGKVFKWNFAGLPATLGTVSSSSDGGANDGGTVEFRQPPGSVVAEDACTWVTLTLAFVAGVTKADYHMIDGDEGATLAELWQVLQVGAEALGWNGLGAMDRLFREQQEQLE